MRFQEWRVWVEQGRQDDFSSSAWEVKQGSQRCICRNLGETCGTIFHAPCCKGTKCQSGVSATVVLCYLRSPADEYLRIVFPNESSSCEVMRLADSSIVVLSSSWSCIFSPLLLFCYSSRETFKPISFPTRVGRFADYFYKYR